MAVSTAVEITNFLTESTQQKDPELLQRAFCLLRQIQLEAAVAEELPSTRGTHVSPDLFLHCCEAAIGFGKWDMAKQCIIPVLQHGTSTKANEVRALYCHGMIEASESKALRCELLIQRVVDALTKVVQGIRTALEDPARLPQLVVLGTQHVWNICQPLFRAGTFHTVVAAIGFAVYCLEAIEHSDVAARAQWMVRYAVALNGAGRYGEAGAYMAKAAEFIAAYCPSMRHAAYKVQIALTKQCSNPRVKEAAAAGRIAKYTFTAQTFLAGVADPAATAEEVVAAFEEMAAEFTARESGEPKPAEVPPANAKPGTASKKGTSPRGKKGAVAAPPPPSEAERHEEAALFDETLGDIGLCLALLGHMSHAKRCAALLASSRSLQARVYGEYVAAWVAAAECGGYAVQDALHLDSLSPAVEAQLVEVVRKIERTLQSAIRIADPQQRTHVVQHGAILMWNTALPLLQSKQRALISRSLHAAVARLDEVQSNLNELRALMHYEGALCDADSDYLGKASSRLDKALCIDYRVTPSESRLHGTERPWDRFLAWTRRSLEMRGNLYQTPDGPLDEALLIVEQSRDATVANRVSMLTKAEGILARSEPPEDYAEEEDGAAADGDVNATVVGGAGNNNGNSPPASPMRSAAGKSTPTGKRRPATAGGPPVGTNAPRDLALEARRGDLQHRTQLWHLILSYGWRDKALLAIPVCRAAAKKILSRTWPRRGDRDMLVLQADAHLRLAEMRMAELGRQRLYVAQLKVTEADGGDDDGGVSSAVGGGGTGRGAARAAGADAVIAERLRAVSEVTAAVQSHITAVCDIAMRLIRWGYPDQWLLLNAAIFLWNAFLPSFAANNYMGALEALQVVVPALVDAECRVDPQTETQLYQDVLLAYAKGLVQMFMVRRLAAANASATANGAAAATALGRFCRPQHRDGGGGGRHQAFPRLHRHRPLLGLLGEGVGCVRQGRCAAADADGGEGVFDALLYHPPLPRQADGHRLAGLAAGEAPHHH